MGILIDRDLYFFWAAGFPQPKKNKYCSKFLCAFICTSFPNINNFYWISQFGRVDHFLHFLQSEFSRPPPAPSHADGAVGPSTRRKAWGDTVGRSAARGGGGSKAV